MRLLFSIALALTVSGRTAAASQIAPSRAATFLIPAQTDTLVELVHDASGGYSGEIFMANGACWIRYRVWLEPREAVSRIDVSMTSMVESIPGATPTPLLSARRGRDSVFIVPQGPTPLFPQRSVGVPHNALLGLGSSLAFTEQILLHARAVGGRRVEFPVVEAMTGQTWDAIVTWLDDGRVRLSFGNENWLFTVDRQGRLVEGTSEEGMAVMRVTGDGRWSGLQAQSRRFVTEEQVLEDQQALQSQFHQALATPRPPDFAARIERLIPRMAIRGGVDLALLYAEAADTLRKRRSGLALAQRWAHRAVACADSHDVLKYGDNSLFEARATSRRVLAETQFALGKRDSALLVMRAGIRQLPAWSEPSLQRQLRLAYGAMLESSGHDLEAIATYFEALGLETEGTSLASDRVRPLWKRMAGDDADLEARLQRARGFKWQNDIGTGPGRPGGHLPEWSLRELRGGLVRSSELTRRPRVILFWGSWARGGLELLRRVEAWHRRSVGDRVDVLTVNGELMGPGPTAEGWVRQLAAREKLTVPVLLDEDQAVFRSAQTRSYPSVFFLDRSGTVRHSLMGAPLLPPDSLEAWFEDIRTR